MSKVAHKTPDTVQTMFVFLMTHGNTAYQRFFLNDSESLSSTDTSESLEITSE